jgi:hypothetical protein
MSWPPASWWRTDLPYWKRHLQAHLLEGLAYDRIVWLLCLLGNLDTGWLFRVATVTVMAVLREEMQIEVQGNLGVTWLNDGLPDALTASLAALGLELLGLVAHAFAYSIGLV